MDIFIALEIYSFSRNGISFNIHVYTVLPTLVHYIIFFKCSACIVLVLFSVNFYSFTHSIRKPLRWSVWKQTGFVPYEYVFSYALRFFNDNPRKWFLTYEWNMKRGKFQFWKVYCKHFLKLTVTNGIYILRNCGFLSGFHKHIYIFTEKLK